MSHSKRNTSLAFFTSHERSLLKSTWGSQATRLSRDSFLPFASCQLCLQIARDPVACASSGDIFCRECAVSNLLAQGKEIKRLKKEDERRQREVEEEEMDRGAEEKERAIAHFERTMMGMEGGGKKEGKISTSEEVERNESRGVKRKFELDEDEMLKNAKEERAKARKALDEEKSAKPTLPSFWVPSLTPSTNHAQASKAAKLAPLCPASSPENKHSLSLKSIITINFKTIPNASSPAEPPTCICPACEKNLTNTIKAVLAIPCGHVLCKPCAAKFMSPDKSPPDPHASPTKQDGENRVACYVCETDLSGKKAKAKQGDDGVKAEKGAVKPGMVELMSEGTGFAGGGDNMIQRKGVAFQC
ncbi:MAG: hypothetical protein ASARMPREDX12_004437 [Alectoria sarmentosa]|nr:MAG: hypothetical protein ASARMPREDX12_004437 [Alectoria sarmentosa]